MKLLLKSATIIDEGSPYHKQKTDILIEDGIIIKIGNSTKKEEDVKVIELEDLHVSKGWFDSSVSFGEPGYEERETIANGLRTAAKSGFTAIALNPVSNPVIDNNGAVTSILSKAARHPVQMFPIGTLTVRSEGKDLAELFDMKSAGAIAFGDYKKPVKNPNLLKLALQYTQNFNGLVLSFPQDNDIAGKGLVNEGENSIHLGLKGIPSFAEELQIARDLAVLEYAGGKLHIPTISTGRSVEMIREAKVKGLDVTCSVAIHNITFSDELLMEFDTNAKVLPPLRTKKDAAKLKEGLEDGTIDFVTSDHNPVDIEHKKVEFEHATFGTIGLETLFGSLMNIFSLEETIQYLTNGRSRFGIEEPIIKEGEPANLSLFNPNGKSRFTAEKIYSSSRNSLFLDSDLMGKVYGIVSGDNLVL